MNSSVGNKSAEPTALSGIRVIDLSTLFAAPLIATNLGDFGAEVIKIEHPRGDDLRHWGLSKNSIPLWWKTLSRNKELISLDLNQEPAREYLRTLVKDTDILIENFRPGRMEAWGLGYEALSARNPGLIMVRVSGFGQTGPRRERPGFGTLAEAYSGFAYITGAPDGPPTLPAFGLADGIAAQVGTYAAMMALYWRDARHGGLGQVVDVSLYEPLFSILSVQVTEYAELGVLQQRLGNRSPRTSPRNAYSTADGHWVALSGGTQQIADRIFRAIDLPELSSDTRFSSPGARQEHADTLDTLVADWIASHPLSKVLASFEVAEAPIAPIYNAQQIFEDDHYWERQTLVSMPDPDLGEITMANVVPRLSRTPGKIRHTGKVRIGADQDKVDARIHANVDRVLPRPWDRLLTARDRELVETARFGRRVGLGEHPAIIVVDAQNYMVEAPPGATSAYPSACGEPAKHALARLNSLLTVARRAGAPIVFTRFELGRDGRDIGVYGRKRELLTTEGWCLEGTEGAAISSLVEPEQGDTVLVKKKPSAFLGTPLLGLLIDWKVDTLIITGGSTSNCVRATTVDAASYNFRASVIEDCVFDRFEISHLVSLFDLDRQYADVLHSAQILTYFEGLLNGAGSEPVT